MAYKITEDCISCGACETECPNEAITEGETIYIIAPEKCTECVGSFDSSRCADVCPVDACVQDEDCQVRSGGVPVLPRHPGPHCQAGSIGDEPASQAFDHLRRHP